MSKSNAIAQQKQSKPKAKPKPKRKLNAQHLNDELFWKALEENAGLFARTKRYIEQKYKITYTRSAIEIRAKKEPERLAQIQEQFVDDAEETVVTIMRIGQPALRLKAAEIILKAKGRRRGYSDRPSVEVSATTGQPGAEGSAEQPVQTTLIIKVAQD